jgi:hypothetical protein
MNMLSTPFNAFAVIDSEQSICPYKNKTTRLKQNAGPDSFSNLQKTPDVRLPPLPVNFSGCGKADLRLWIFFCLILL